MHPDAILLCKLAGWAAAVVCTWVLAVAVMAATLMLAYRADELLYRAIWGA